VRALLWEIGLTIQCSGFICSVSQIMSALILLIAGQVELNGYPISYEHLRGVSKS
jgi:hypothetical protein